MATNLAAYIDHTLLKPESTEQQIITLCEEAKTYNFASVCVNPTWVEIAASVLQGSEVKVCTVIGFPLGANTSAIKAFETKAAISEGATEIDMVINVGAAKDGKWDVVEKDIKAVVQEAKGKAIVKVIIETCLLTNEQIVEASKAAKKAGADFVKTSTGFSTGGATVEDVRLMRTTVGEEMGVKASGGIRNLEDMQQMIEAGATRIGASAGVKIMQGLTSDSSY